jgi:hypothetical protein
MVLEPPSNAKPCDTGTLHDMALTADEDIRSLRGRVCNTLVPY